MKFDKVIAPIHNKTKVYAYLAALVLLSNSSIDAQIVFYASDGIEEGDIRLEIGENVSNADIKIKIGEDINWPHFSVGFTDDNLNADFIIADNTEASDVKISVNPLQGEVDYKIKASENIKFPDVRINISKAMDADYLIYTGGKPMNTSDMIAALLPAINNELLYKMANVPQYVRQWENFQLSPGMTIMANTTWANIAAKRYLASIRQTTISLANKNLILVACNSSMQFPMRPYYNELEELKLDLNDTRHVLGRANYLYFFQMNQDGSLSVKSFYQ